MPYLTQFNPNLWYKDPLSTNWKQTKYRKMLSKIKTEASLDRPGIWYLHCISALAACQWVTIERILGTVNVLAGGGKTNHLCSVSWEIKRLLIVFPKSITSLTRLRSWKLHHALNTAQRHCVVFFSKVLLSSLESKFCDRVWQAWSWSHHYRHLGCSVESGVWT